MSDAVPEVAAEVLAEALRQARDDAVAELRPVLAAQLVQAARLLMAQDRAVLAEPADGSFSARAATRPDPVGRGWYVYGLTWQQVARNFSGTEGLAGSAVEILSVGRVAALGSWIDVAACDWATDSADGSIEALAPRLQEHERVLEAVLDEGPVLPMKFGRVYPAPDRLEESLRRDADAIDAALRRLDGRAEWGLTVEWDPAEARSLGEAGRDGAAGGYLARRRAELSRSEAAEGQARDAAGRVHAALSRLADGQVLHPARNRKGGPRPVILRASYLVARRDAERFRQAAADALTSAPGGIALTGEITGPWPPYNFSGFDTEAVPA